MVKRCYSRRGFECHLSFDRSARLSHKGFDGTPGFALYAAAFASCRLFIRVGLRRPFNGRRYVLVAHDRICELLFQPAGCCFR